MLLELLTVLLEYISIYNLISKDYSIAQKSTHYAQKFMPV